MMKKIILATIAFLYLNSAFAQLVPISLDERIDKATTIFEGRVVSQTSYWDESN